MLLRSAGRRGQRPDGERVDGQDESPTGAVDARANAMRKSGQAFKVE